MSRCAKCAEILERTPEELVLFPPYWMDRCPTRLWWEREAERIRTMAVLEHARYGHPDDR